MYVEPSFFRYLSCLGRVRVASNCPLTLSSSGF